MSSLTQREIDRLPRKRKSYKRHDGHGLYLIIPPGGNLRWRYRYHQNNKEKNISLGVYPDVSLAQAREYSNKMNIDRSSGMDVHEQHKAATLNPFQTIATEWHQKYAGGWTPEHAEHLINYLHNDVYPALGACPIEKITAPDILAVVRGIEQQGHANTAHRVKQLIGRVLRYAVATGRATRDISPDLSGALAPASHHPFPAITDPVRIAKLMQAIHNDHSPIQPVLLLAAFLFLRPGELRGLRWSEIDLATAQIRIPPERMKMKNLHIVPLARQPMSLIASLDRYGDYVFPHAKKHDQPLPADAVNRALRRLGFPAHEMCFHGFRKMASTVLNEQGFNADWIERQLAHAPKDGVRAAYNYAQYLKERAEMMQWWSDWLSKLKQPNDCLGDQIHQDS
jgi:integrase